MGMDRQFLSLAPLLSLNESEPFSIACLLDEKSLKMIFGGSFS
jgi:hypothetical protein